MFERLVCCLSLYLAGLVVAVEWYRGPEVELLLPSQERVTHVELCPPSVERVTPLSPVLSLMLQASPSLERVTLLPLELCLPSLERLTPDAGCCCWLSLERVTQVTLRWLVAPAIRMIWTLLLGILQSNTRSGRYTALDADTRLPGLVTLTATSAILSA